MSDSYTPSDYYATYGQHQAEEEYRQSHELATRIQHVSQVAPYLADDPEVLLATANMPVDMDRLGYLAGAVSAQMRLDGTRQDLERMEAGRARVVFSQLTPTQQNALRQAGYNPPSSDNEGSNPFLSAIGTAGGVILGGVNTVVTKTPVVSQVFDVMNTLDNGIKTLYRGIRTDDQAGLATLAMIGGGVLAAPFTGGLSLGATAAVIGGSALAAGTGAALLTNPSDYIEALDDNWNGEAVFSKAAQEQARTLLRSSGLDVMARDIGWEMDSWETVKLFASNPDATSDQQFFASIERVVDRIADKGDPRREEVTAKLVELIQVPEFREAVEVLQHSKVSFGRDVARLAGMEPGTTGYNVLSGAMDGMFTIALDPTLMGASAVKLNRARRLGVPIAAGEDMFQTINAIAERANSVPTIGRAYDEIARAVAEDKPHLLWRRVRNSKGLYEDLWNYKQLRIDAGDLDRPFNRDDIFQWLRDGGDFERMLAGHGVVQGQGRLMLPSYGFRVPGTQYVVAPGAKLAEGLKATIDFADDAANRAHLRKVARQLGKTLDDTPRSAEVTDNLNASLRHSPTSEDEWRHIKDLVDFVDKFPVLNRVMRYSGQLLASFTEMMPATNSISMIGPQSFDEIQRMVALGRTAGMSSVTRKAWFDTIIQQDNAEQRINASLSFLDTMIRMGTASTDRADELAAQFITKMKHRYHLGNADQYLMGERTVSRAIHPYQHTFDLPIPDLKEMRQLVDKGLLLKYVYRVTDSDIADIAINQMWKPAVLMRLGFITRAAGEELLAHLARVGPSSLINEFGERAVAEGKIISQLDVSGLTDAQREAVSRMKYLAHVRPLERMFSAYEWMDPANDVLRRYSDFVRTMLERGVMPGLAERIPESRKLALLGKEGGIRNAILTGVDPDMIRYMELFTKKHATTIMREISSQNASVAAELKPGDFSMRFRDETDELQEIGYVVERGQFRTYTAQGDSGDDLFDRMAHSSAAKIVSDEVTGPVHVQTMSRYAHPNVPDDIAYAALNDYRAATTHSADFGGKSEWRVQSIVDELLTAHDPQTMTWESTLHRLAQHEPELADALRASHRIVGPDITDAEAVFATMRRWARGRYRGTEGVTRYGQEVLDQIDRAEDLVRRMADLGETERAWVASFVDVWGRTPETPELFHSFEEYKSETRRLLADRHYDPEVQPLVNNLTYTNRLDDGSMVAHPPREGRTRIWVPQVTAETYGVMLRELSTGSPMEFVNRLMALWLDAQPHLDGHAIAQSEKIVRRFIARMALEDKTNLARHAADVASAGRHGDLIPLAHMGFDDPDLAQQISQFLNASLSRKGAELTMAGRLRDNRGYVATLDLDDKLRNYWPTDIDGAKRPVAHQQWHEKVRYEDVEITEEVTELRDVPLKPDAPEPPLPDRFKIDLSSPAAYEVIDVPGLDIGLNADSVRTQELIERLDPATTEIHFIAGGREYRDREAMLTHLTRVAQEAAARGKHVVLVEGGARGADSLAGKIAGELGMKVIEVPAAWRGTGIYSGRGAGFRRNEWMAAFINDFKEGRAILGRGDPRPFHVTAAVFPGGNGTAHMRGQLSNFGIPTYSPASSILEPTTVTTATSRFERIAHAERTTPKVSERVIHSWALDREMLTPRTVSMADRQIITLPDGSRQFGVDPRVALEAGAEKMVNDWVNHIADTNQRRIVRGEAYLDPGATRQIEPGTEITSREQLYDAKGVPLQYDDPEVFSLMEPNVDALHIHDNWSMIGPLLRDGADTHAGTARLLPDTRPFKDSRGKRGGRVRADEAVRQALADPKIREFRGHWTHMKGLKHAPKVAIGPVLRQIEAPSKWDIVKGGFFEKVVAPSIDAIIRRPMAAHFFAEAMQENVRAKRWMLSQHIFGDEATGDVGELSRRFESVLAHPDLVRSVDDAAADVLAATRVLAPEDYAVLKDLEPQQILNAYYGKYPEQQIAKGTMNAQARAAERAMRHEREQVILDRIAEAPESGALKKTIRGIQQQTETPMTRLMSIAHDPRKPKQNLGWVPFDANRVQPGSMVVDVPTAQVSSASNALNRGQFRAMVDIYSEPVPWREALPLQNRRISEATVIAEMRQWMRTGVRPAGWENVSDVAHKKLSRYLKDLAEDTNTFELFNGYSFGEWQEAIDAVDRAAKMPLWTNKVRNNPRPIEGVLDAYIDILDDKLALSWAEVQPHLSALPPALRAPLDETTWGVLSPAYKNVARLEETIANLSAERAIRNAMPFLDSHEIRSQAGEYVRGFFPFMYAEENFLKRWARTLVIAPDALRKGQLVYMGLQSGGVIRTDSQGRDWYVYPGAGLLAETVNHSTQAFGFGEVLPTGVVFATETKNILPGFDIERTGMPSANPLVAMPIGGLASMFHELRPIQEALVGQAGVAQGGVRQFVPTAARRFWDIAGDENSNVKYASAMMSAIAILEHNGHGLPSGATKNQLDDYIRRVRNHTRGILAAQAFAGFIVPGSPSAQFTGEGALSAQNLAGLDVEIPADIFRAEYLQMVRELGIEEGTIAYFALNPDHDVHDLIPFTVGQSRSSSGAPLPATHEAVRFADENQGFLEQYPMAAAWLLPQPDPNEEDFDEYAYVQQSISGLRQKRTPTEFMEALKYREGSMDYFKTQERHEQLMKESEGDSLRRKQLTDVWNTWKARHFAMHPVFAEQLQGGESRERRARVLTELRTIVEDPSTPQVAHLEGVRQLVRTFDLYTVTIAQMSESRSAAAQDKVHAFKLTFEDIITNYLVDHPELEPLWLSVLRPEANL